MIELCIFLTIGIVGTGLYLQRRYMSPVYPDMPSAEFFEEYAKLRGMINDWIRDEEISSSFLVQNRGIEALLPYSLSTINFKTVGILDDTDRFLKSLLRDNSDCLAYSRLLDLYMTVQVQLSSLFVSTISYRYFKSLHLTSTPYAHDVKQVRAVQKDYPYLWLCAEIGIAYRALHPSQIDMS